MLRSLATLLPLTVAATSLAAPVTAQAQWLGGDVGVVGPSVTDVVGPEACGMEITSINGRRPQTAMLAVDVCGYDADEDCEGVFRHHQLFVLNNRSIGGYRVDVD
ncbi:hypothetical protein [Brevundimonas sp. DWR2-3-1b1]|uniref:hypothetical protein n=1 Tax=unclassified Brevundimonas TaxID=2622653 RepID=UPI003CFB9CE3